MVEKNLTIQEQFPLLPIEGTPAVDRECRIMHEVKYAQALAKLSTLEKLEVERRFWRGRNIKWTILTEHDLLQT